MHIDVKIKHEHVLDNYLFAIHEHMIKRKKIDGVVFSLMIPRFLGLGKNSNNISASVAVKKTF